MAVRNVQRWQGSYLSYLSDISHIGCWYCCRLRRCRHLPGERSSSSQWFFFGWRNREKYASAHMLMWRGIPNRTNDTCREWYHYLEQISSFSLSLCWSPNICRHSHLLLVRECAFDWTGMCRCDWWFTSVCRSSAAKTKCHCRECLISVRSSCEGEILCNRSIREEKVREDRNKLIGKTTTSDLLRFLSADVD